MHEEYYEDEGLVGGRLVRFDGHGVEIDEGNPWHQRPKLRHVRVGPYVGIRMQTADERRLAFRPDHLTVYKCDCGNVHSLGKPVRIAEAVGAHISFVEKWARYADCEAWNCPNCKRGHDSRQFHMGGSWFSKTLEVILIPYSQIISARADND